MTPLRRSPHLSLALALCLLGSIMPEKASGGEIVPLPGPPPPGVSASRWNALQTRLFGAPEGTSLVESTDPPAPPADLPTSGASSQASWSEIPPPALWLHSTIYDPGRDRLVVFGGENGSGRTNEVWQLTLSGSPLWTKCGTTGIKPTARSRQTGAYDPVRSRMILFGGYDGAYKNDVAILYLTSAPVWVQAVVQGTPPAPRAWASAVYDPVRDRMLFLGGTNEGTTYSDVWALSFRGDTLTWSPLAASGTPGPRAASAAIYDAGRDRVVIFAGMDATGLPRNDVWALSLGPTPAWTQVTPTGAPPSPRNGASALYDPVRQRMMIFAGGQGSPNSNETWALSLPGTPAWTKLTPTNVPSGRQFHTAVYDPIGDRMIVFGGSNGPILSGTWALSLSATETWVPLSGTRRRGHLAIHDPLRHRMVVIDGDDGAALDDVWQLDLSAPPTWLKLTASGVSPGPRAFHAGVYDPQRDRVVFFGGRNGAPLADTWELSFSGSLTWRQLFPTGTPPSARIDHAVIYDPLRHRMILFGGTDGAGNPKNDVWALSLSCTPVWTQLFPTGGAPAARGAAVAVYDATRDRMVLFGGYDNLVNALSDCWQLSLSGTPAWSPLAVTGTPPAPRFSPAAAYDSQRERIVLYGGTDLIASYSDVYELTLFGSPAWNALVPSGGMPQARADHKGIYDPQDDRMVMFGGSGLTGGMLNDTWSLAFQGTVDARTAPIAGPRVLPVAPNPARADMRLTFEAGEPVRARIAVYAPSGRLVRELWNGPAEAGRHTVAWDGSDAGGVRVPAGVYLYVAAIGAERYSGKLVRVE